MAPFILTDRMRPVGVNGGGVLLGIRDCWKALAERGVPPRAVAGRRRVAVQSLAIRQRKALTFRRTSTAKRADAQRQAAASRIFNDGVASRRTEGDLARTTPAT